MIWLSLDQIIDLHGQLMQVTGGLDGIRDHGILESTLAAPMLTYDSKELFPSVIEKAARLAFGLVQFHPFIDGNKRIAAHAMLVVLKLNGISLCYTQKELSDIFLELAGSTADYDQLLTWVKAHLA